MKILYAKPTYEPYVTDLTVNEKTWIKVTKKDDR